MNKIETYCTIESGTIRVVNRKRFQESLVSLKNGRYVLSVERKYRKRSNPQNAYLWGVVYPIILKALIDSGFDDIDINGVHDLMKYKFLKNDLVSRDGEVLESFKSTAKLTTTEFMEYLAQITRWCAEYLQIEIPQPGEEMEIEFK